MTQLNLVAVSQGVSLRTEPLVVDERAVAAPKIHNRVAAFARYDDRMGITDRWIGEGDVVVSSLPDFNLMFIDRVFELFAGRQYADQLRFIVMPHFFAYLGECRKPDNKRRSNFASHSLDSIGVSRICHCKNYCIPILRKCKNLMFTSELWRKLSYYCVINLGAIQVNVRVRIAEINRQITRQLGFNWQALV